MYRLQVKTHFDAAHYIKDYKGKCSRMHGHRWEVEAVYECELLLLGMNMVADFSEIKANLGSLTDKLDHTVLNDVLGESNLTAEFLAKWFWNNLPAAAQHDAPLACVTVWESPDCGVKYYESS